jgi:hypothetical protein
MEKRQDRLELARVTLRRQQLMLMGALVALLSSIVVLIPRILHLLHVLHAHS